MSHPVPSPERIREWRETRSLSVAAAARATGVARNAWFAYEAGTATPRPWFGFVLRAVGDGLAPYR